MFKIGEDKGISIELKKGEMELKITMDSDITKSKIEAVKDIISPFTYPENSSKIPEMTAREESSTRSKNDSNNSLFYRLKVLIANVFRYGQIFNSKDAREAFEEIFGERINASTCSTYLRRMERDGFLTSEREGRIIEYRLSKSRTDLPSLEEVEKEEQKKIELPKVKNLK